MTNAQEMHNAILEEKPETVGELFQVLVSYGFQDFKIMPVYYYGHLQGVRVQVGKAFIPSKSKVYLIMKGV